MLLTPHLIGAARAASRAPKRLPVPVSRFPYGCQDRSEFGLCGLWREPVGKSDFLHFGLGFLPTIRGYWGTQLIAFLERAVRTTADETSPADLDVDPFTFCCFAFGP